MTGLCLLPEKLLTFPPLTPIFFHSLCCCTELSTPRHVLAGRLGHSSTSPGPPDRRGSICLALPPGSSQRSYFRHSPTNPLKPELGGHQDGHLPESSFPRLPLPCHLKTNIRSLTQPLVSRKGLKPMPNSASSPLPGHSSRTPVLCHISLHAACLPQISIKINLCMYTLYSPFPISMTRQLLMRSGCIFSHLISGRRPGGEDLPWRSCPGLSPLSSTCSHPRPGLSPTHRPSHHSPPAPVHSAF